MGLLRFLLAICVVVGHVGGAEFLKVFSGSFAVEVFFAISGFYMALILDGKYKSAKDFYFSRILRLFPVYFIVLFFSFLLLFFISRIDFSTLSFASLFYVIFTNLTLIGQDISLFAELIAGESGLLEISFINDYTKSQNPLHHYLLVDTSWSLSLELYFYLLAPFLVRFSIKKLILIAALSFFGKLAFFLGGNLVGGWLFRFFPFEIFFFIFGVLAYKIGYVFKGFNQKNIYFLLFAMILFIGYLDEFFGARVSYLLVFLLPLFIPTIFDAFKNNKFDNFLGELSYPIYLVHIVIQNNFHLGIYYNVLLSILFSIFVVVFIEKKIDRFRHDTFIKRK